ncbi:MAG: aminotransferase class V-fold PLP-dependent enzyme [Planctomycetaceae bacterium]
MAPLLYLDTARLGQTLPAARDAHIDFVRLTTEEPSSLYFEEFLKHGYAAWPDYYQHRFPGLSVWTGIAGLKQTLRRLAGAPDDCEVLLASRSLALVQIAAKAMFQVCRNVLCTDLNWTTYQDVVAHEAATTGSRVTVVPLRNFIFHHGWTANDVVDYLAEVYDKHHCDGLFLPAVDHLGIRVPVKRIHERIRQQKPINYTLIDAAQAFCHVPIDDDLTVANFLITGCHKWMRAGQPMGIGFCCSQPRSRLDTPVPVDFDRRADPLLDFTAGVESDELDTHFETVNLSSLIAAAGAAATSLPIAALPFNRFQDPYTEFHAWFSGNADQWQQIGPSADMQSGIRLFQPTNPKHQQLTADAMRRFWLSAGCVLSAYAGGLIRLSAPVLPQTCLSGIGQPRRLTWCAVPRMIHEQVYQKPIDSVTAGENKDQTDAVSTLADNRTTA